MVVDLICPRAVFLDHLLSFSNSISYLPLHATCGGSCQGPASGRRQLQTHEQSKARDTATYQRDIDSFAFWSMCQNSCNTEKGGFASEVLLALLASSHNYLRSLNTHTHHDLRNDSEVFGC